MITLPNWSFVVMCVLLTSRSGACGDRYLLTSEYTIDKFEAVSVSLSPSGARFSASDGSSRLIVCDTQDGKIRVNLVSKADLLWDTVAFIEEQTLASCNGGRVVLWSIDKGKESVPYVVDTPREVILSTSNLPPKKILCAGNCLDCVLLLDMNENKCVGTFKADKFSGTIAACNAKDKKALYAISTSGDLLTWNAENEKLSHSLNLGRSISAAAFGSTGDFLFLCKEVRKGEDQSHFATILKVEDGKEITPMTQLKSRVTCVAALPSGGFVCGFTDGSLGLFDKAGFSQLGKSSHDSAVTCISVSSNGLTILSASSSGSIKVWSMTPDKR